VTAAIASLLIAGGAVAFVMMSSHSGHAAGEVYGTFGSFGIPSGATSKEVLARLGAPDEKRDGCWVYRVNGKTFHGTRILPQIAGIDAVGTALEHCRRRIQRRRPLAPSQRPEPVRSSVDGADRVRLRRRTLRHAAMKPPG
jgi:hypothetical protein